MLGHYQTLLAGVAANPDTRLSALPLLSPAEENLVRCTWNDTSTDYGAARVRPPTVQGAGGTDSLRRGTPRGRRTAHLRRADRRANQLARHLTSQGVRPGAKVGVCLERSTTLVVALLGILKAGAAYVPLDPDYPPHRLALMREDSRASVLLTTSDFVGKLPGGRRKWCGSIPTGPPSSPRKATPRPRAQPRPRASPT